MQGASLYLLLIILPVVVSTIGFNFYDKNVCGHETSYSGFEIKDANGNTGAPTNIVPWAVQIGFIIDGKYEMRCGGTLVTEKHVLTTAHCFRKFQAHQDNEGAMPGQKCQVSDRYDSKEIFFKTRVTVGAMCTKMSEKHGCVHEKQLGRKLQIQKFKFANFFEHGCSSGNDLVILELFGSIRGIEGANYACLPFDISYNINQNLTSFGWGADPKQGVSEAYYPVIQTISLEPENREVCRSKWGTEIAWDAFCTVEEKTKNMCTGDSGGGLTIERNSAEYLIAIASYGSDCESLLEGMPPKAQINTDIRAHSRFITNFINRVKF